MTDVLMLTRLSAVKDGIAEIQLRAQDFAGDRDQGGVRLFDGTSYVDVPLQYADTIENPRGPADDLWTIKLPVPEGLDADNLQVTGWVDLLAGAPRIWEGRDHAVQESAVDRLVNIGPERPPGSHSYTLNDGMQTAAGTAELTTYRRGDMTGSHTMGYTSGLKRIAMTDDNGFFGGADSIQALVIPLTYHDDYRGAFDNRELYVTRELRDLRGMNRVTLEKSVQPDGTVQYSREAPEGQAFARTIGSTGYTPYADPYDWRGYEVAFVDPATGRWDSNGGQNYRFDRGGGSPSPGG